MSVLCKLLFPVISTASLSTVRHLSCHMFSHFENYKTRPTCTRDAHNTHYCKVLKGSRLPSGPTSVMQEDNWPFSDTTNLFLLA